MTHLDYLIQEFEFEKDLDIEMEIAMSGLSHDEWMVEKQKTKRAEQIFNCLKMIQHNFHHYANIHGFISSTFRNDYGLTLATRIVNGHLTTKEDVIPWNLLHVGKNTTVYRNNDDEFNNEYTVMFDNWNRGKIRKEYITIKDTDFHVMNKENFMELISE
jgi:hypothetical protein